MRTQLDRNVENSSALCDTVTAIWFEAYRQGQSFKWILDSIKTRVYDTKRFKKLPAWGQARVTQTSSTMLRSAQGWMTANVWIHEGTAYANNWDKLPEHIRELIRKDKLKLITIWSEYSSRFTDKLASEVKIFSNAD